MQNFWNENIEALRKKDRLLHQKVANYTMEDIGEVIPTKALPTLRFKYPGEKNPYAYNSWDPIKEIQEKLAILKNEKNLNTTICVFIGLGLGYRQLVALNDRKDIFRMIVIEPSLDVFHLALKYVDLGPLFKSDKVFLMAGDINWETFDTIINNKDFSTSFLISDHSPLFDWNPELYNHAKSTASTLITRSIAAFNTLGKFGIQIFKNRISNLTLLREAQSVDVLKGVFKDKPVVIVSGGPSLNKSMKYLKKIVGKCLLIAVDSAVAPLLQNKITPDIVTTLDYRNLNSEKLSPDVMESKDFSIVAAIISSSLSAKRLPLKNLFFSFQENDTQDWILNALKVKHQMPPVGTVALLSLCLAQMVEADPIILVGYDFALTSVEDDHVKGAVFSHGWHQQNSKFITVLGIDKKPVNTLPFLLEFKQNFELLINKQNDRNYINATASGADIVGTRVQNLGSVIEQYITTNISVDNLIDEQTRLDGHPKVISFITAAQKELSAAKKILEQVRKIINLNGKILSFLKKKKGNQGDINHFSQLPSKIKASKQKLIKLRVKFKLFMAIEEVAAEKVLEANRIQEIEITKNFIEQLDKESRVIELEMQGHQSGLETFIKSIGDLVSFLKKEDQILSKIEKNEYNEHDLIGLGDLYLNFMEAHKARNILERCIKEYPNSSRAIFHMGEAQAQLLDFDSAFRYWQDAQNKSSELNNDIIKKRKDLAEYWSQRGKEEPAIREKCLSRALRLFNEKEFCQSLKDNHWPACHGIIKRQIDNKQISQAELFLKLWQPIQDSTPVWYYLMARVHFQKEDKVKALALIEKALESHPNNPEWNAFLARLLLETDQFDQGIARLEKAVQLDSAQAVLWEELGDSLFEARDFTTAAIAYEKCFVALPDMVDVLRKFGDCYFFTQQFEVAKNAYLKVLEQDSDNEFARTNLAKIKD